MSRFSSCLVLVLLIAPVYAQGVTGYTPPKRHDSNIPTLRGHTARPLRYRPEGTDFVIENGSEFFNRPLYGANTDFRCDAGDKPELSLYMRGRGGNVRFALKTQKALKWLQNCSDIVARYRPGCIIYDINDPALGSGSLRLTVQSFFDRDGILVRLEAHNVLEPLTLITAFGGANGMRCRRNGDIGCESQPVAQLFQLRPDQCRGDIYHLHANTFHVKSSRKALYGVFAPETSLSLADARQWNDLPALLASTGKAPPTLLLIAQTPCRRGKSQYLAIQRVNAGFKALTARELPDLYIRSERERLLRAHQVRVDTPDPYINAAMAALCMAADGIWDEASGTVMHGAVAWRKKLLGWRGPYANDVLGRHDRAKRHFTYWANQQNTPPIPDHIPPADPKAHLARNEPALHSNGALSHSHYDMNLVYIDALFRHFLWTGDLDLARQCWPVIERHLAWERRLFRRPFGPHQLPLYEAYAAIWASDDMEYEGGGVTYTSAYNLWHNRMAARLARQLGKNPHPYEQEAHAIAQAMQQELWLPQKGWYAEWKDLLGRQAVHPYGGLWTFYHTLDSHAADPFQAWQMTRYVDTQLAHIPIHGPGVPDEGLYTLPTSSWMPYTWSTNNVVMAEVAHTSLGFWQANRPAEAFKMFKGCLLDSMFMGLCPGNAGMCTTFDAARGEAQRDFADAVGMDTRAMVEGLFGVQPDLLAGVLHLKPGWPASWQHARIMHPELDFTYQRDGLSETYTIKPKFKKPVIVDLTIRARRDQVASVTLNGDPIAWSCVSDSIGTARLNLKLPAARRSDVRIVWQGHPLVQPKVPAVLAIGASLDLEIPGTAIKAFKDPQGALSQCHIENHCLRATVSNEPGPRTCFVQLTQAELTWWAPVTFVARPAFEILDPGVQTVGPLHFSLRNNTSSPVQQNATVYIGPATHTVSLDLPPHATQALSFDTDHLLPGTQAVTLQCPGSPVIHGRVVDWRIDAPKKRPFSPVTLPPNGTLTEIFHQNYLTPRSPYCSLAIPQQGIGSWCHYDATFDVNDAGLKIKARQGGGWFTLPNHVAFLLPPTRDQDTVFTSQWDNYPNDVTIPLSGRARHLYLLMAGTTNSMQSRFDNGEVIVTYADDTQQHLALHNPTTWWPIDQDYFIDDYAFARPQPVPPRIDLKTGRIRIWDPQDFHHKNTRIPGGAATVLDLPLRSDKSLASMTVRALANEVIIGLMGATLIR